MSKTAFPGSGFSSRRPPRPREEKDMDLEPNQVIDVLWRWDTVSSVEYIDEPGEYAHKITIIVPFGNDEEMAQDAWLHMEANA